MRKRSKFILIWLTLCIALLGLVSCKDDGTVSGKDDPPSVIDEDVIYSPYVNTTIILGEGVDERDVSAIRNAYYKRVGKEISIGTSANSLDHGITVGKTDSELSERAYRYLARFKSNEDHVGYVIYSDGRSVAIAFDEASFGEAVAFKEAINCFVSEYMKADSLKLGSGAVCSDSFDAIEKRRERDEENIEKLWGLKLSQIAQKVDDEEKAAVILDELRDLHFVFSKDYKIITWLANLYDPVSGGFYYSNSARNNEGFLPDLESTSGALSIIESILTEYGGTLNDYLGEEIASKFVTFARGMQDENGYFYHPQWSRELVDKNQAKRSRDVLNALNILNFFDASPVYDTPNGVKGDGIAAPASKLVLPIRKNMISAVSQLVSAENDEIYIPAHIKSKEAFESYLLTLNIRSDTAGVCETLYSELPLYLRVDEILEENGEKYRLSEILEGFLSGKQDRNTGLWSEAGEITSEDIGTLAGVAKIYSGLGKIIPRYETIFATIKDHLKFEEEPDDISDISLPWSSLASVVNNITSYGDKISEDEIKKSLASLYYDFDITLKTTKEKLMLFLRDDGSFSTTPDGSASEQHGMSIALPAMDEGDMNATLLATKNIWLAIFNSLNEGFVPIFNTSDRMMFAKTLLDMGVIIKNEVKKAEPEDFESYEIGTTSGVRHNAGSSGGIAEIIEGPENKGQVLKLYSPVDSGDEFYFDVVSGAKIASCFAAEFDMCIRPETSTGTFAMMYLWRELYMIALDRQGDEIRLLERSSRTLDYSYTRDLGVSIKPDEWFNLRVEYYAGTDSTVRIKVYFNGECIAVSDNYFESPARKFDGAGVPNSDYSGFAVFAVGSKNTDMLIDNVITEKTYQTYTPETSSSLNINVDTPDKSQTIHNFEKYQQGSTPIGFKPSGDKASVVVDTDSDGNRLLSFGSGGGEVVLPLDQRGSGVNSALLEFDFTFSPDCAVGTKYQINFNEYFYQARSFAAMQLIVAEDGGSKYMTFADVASGTAGAAYSGVRLSPGVKYHLNFRLFFDECALVVSVDGEIVGINSNVLDGCKKFNMGEVTIEAITPALQSAILIDNLVCEKVRNSYEETTAPSVERENHGFDTTDGMELSGVSPSEGMLSFESAGAGDSYVKIPVNTRVNVPTMSLVGFDIIRTESISGSLVLTFEDKSGNIVAAFELVRGESDVKIYEYTKNGRYSAPIHSVNKPSFNLSIEYSPERESFNLLVDGEYVAASSMTYTLDSGEYGFEYFSITSQGPSGLAIDDLYAEKICGVFKAHKVSMPNTDGTGKVITYETSSFASLPSGHQYALGSTTSYLRIKEGGIGNAVSKVLEMKCDKGSTAVIFSRTQTQGDANAAFFETDMMLRSTGSLFRLMLEMQSREGGAYTFSIETSAAGAPLKIIGADGKDFSRELDVKDGEWFKIRIEYRDTPHDFDYDGYNDCVFRVYINGELVEEAHTPRSITAMRPAPDIYQTRVRSESGRSGIAYLDNTSFGQFNMTYTPPYPADTDTITYEPGVITNKTQFTFSGKNSTAKISEMTVKGEVTKVLEFNSAQGSTDKLSVSPTVTLDGANGIMFETDIMIDPASDTATFYLEPTTLSGKYPFRLTINAYKGGNVTISSYNSKGVHDTGFEKETVIGRCGEWIHLKVEFMNPLADYDGDRINDILYKVYIGDYTEPIATGYKPYTLSSYFDPQLITKYAFTSVSASSAGIFLDNTRFWQVELVPDEAPEFDYSEGGALDGPTGDRFDNNGWV